MMSFQLIVDTWSETTAVFPTTLVRGRAARATEQIHIAGLVGPGSTVTEDRSRHIASTRPCGSLASGGYDTAVTQERIDVEFGATLRSKELPSVRTFVAR